MKHLLLILAGVQLALLAARIADPTVPWWVAVFPALLLFGGAAVGCLLLLLLLALIGLGERFE